MNWLILTAAGMLEIVWAVGLKYTQGFTKLWPSVITLISLVGSFAMLGLALKTLPVGTAYAVWVGIGIVGTAVAGIILFGESLDLIKLASLCFICIGIAGLKMSNL